MRGIGNFVGGFLAGLRRPETFDVVVFGDSHPSWFEALAASAPVWDGIEVGSVTGRPDRWDAATDLSVAAGRLVIPVRNHNVRDCPGECWTLVPTAEIASAFADKLQFARFVRAHRLDDLAPRTFTATENIVYPALLKRTDLDSSNGLVIVRSESELMACLDREPWRGLPWIVQKLVPGRNDHVTHCVVVGGRIVWHRSYRYELADETTIRGPKSMNRTLPHEASDEELAQMERFFRAARYSGFANFDYKRTAEGIKVFEINPRLGGSLFRSQNLADLRSCLRAFMAHARWRSALMQAAA